jgi:uncharacterized protein (DUF427 family)
MSDTNDIVERPIPETRTDPINGAPEVARRHPVPEGALTYEPSERWVRGIVGDTTIVDSRHPFLVWEPGHAVPRYAFPLEEVRLDLLEAVPAPRESRHLGATTWYDLVVDGGRRPYAAWSYRGAELGGLLAFDWFGRKEPGVDHWFEEEEEIFVHPRDPYKRVDAIRSSRHVQVSLGDKVLADSRNPILLFETRLPVRYYLPPGDVDFSLLEATELHTSCPYKGTARYWSVPNVASGENIVWSYPDPLAATAAIADHLAFYNERVDITVDGVRLERPQTGFSPGRRAESHAAGSSGG